MGRKKILEGKSVLIVDDNKDVLETLVEILATCKVDVAESFDAGRKLIEKRDYDIAILDIMGVQGFRLLEKCRAKGIPSLILTANALTSESLKKSYQNGASYFVPKEEMSQTDIYLEDVLEAKEQQKDPWIKWFDRFISFFDTKFSGADWRDKEREYFKKKIKAKISIPREDED